MEGKACKPSRPRSPNIQIYRPQLTSVLSIAHRITGIFLSLCSMSVVVWLVAAANGPASYIRFQGVIGSWLGQIVLLIAVFGFFLHVCGGIRHLIWDTAHGFELRHIYISGWLVIATSLMLTLVSWIASRMVWG